jgi:hypothetical protein
MSKKAKSVTIKLKDLPDGNVDIDIKFSPPVSYADAQGAQRWGYQILDEIKRVEAIKITELEVAHGPR